MTDFVDSAARPPGFGADGAPGPPSSPDAESPSADDAQRKIQELTTALAARDSFIALVGHELRNSVAPMVLLAEQFSTLAEDPRVSPIVVSRMALLTRNLNKFVATIDRVAEVADLRRGKLRLELSAVDLVDTVGDVCRDLRREATAGGAELSVIAPPQVIGLWDRIRLKQIISNLVSNAIRYGGGGSIDIHVSATARHAELIVRDHGPGIPPAVLPRLFDAFDHGHVGSSGFGIGLWLVKTLCTAMAGSVTAANASTGGARFCVSLPRG